MRFETETDESNEAEQTKWAIAMRPITNWATIIKLTLD